MTCITRSSTTPYSLALASSPSPISFAHSTSPTNSHPSSNTSSSSPSPPPPYGIITRSKNSIFKPIQKLNLLIQVSYSSSEPSTVSQTLQIPHWWATIKVEYQALLSNNNWILIPFDCTQNVVGC